MKNRIGGTEAKTGREEKGESGERKTRKVVISKVNIS
jgi:hypothetical protein